MSSNQVTERTCIEQFRDNTLNILDSKPVLVLNVLYIILVVADGAFFFFLLVGWHTLGTRDLWETWMNRSIQVLCGLFTYPSLTTMPWRLSNLLHLMRTRCGMGLDFYGSSTEEVWFSVPLKTRIFVTIMLILNSVAQWVNQWARIRYPDYESSNSYPGNFLCNIFFAASFLFGGIGGACQFRAEEKVRRERREETILEKIIGMVKGVKGGKGGGEDKGGTRV